jgi:RNA polymerase sigma-70 factor (ECF subfamily)
MPFPDDHLAPDTATGARFAATSWMAVLAAQRGGSPEATAALEKLCRTYWYPLYGYCRRKGNDPHKA